MVAEPSTGSLGASWAAAGHANVSAARTILKSVLMADSSVQETRVEVGPVDTRVTACTIAAGLEALPSVRHIRGECIDVALQAQEAFFARAEQRLIDAAVRGMARDASFHLHRRVFEDKRTALLNMTLDARFPTGLPHSGAIGGAVSVVTVGALHRAFCNPMVRRQRKLGLNVGVAAETELRLRFLQETAVKPAFVFFYLRHREESALRGRNILLPVHLVCGMAVVAGDPVHRVGGVLEFRLVLAADVARHAAVGVFSRLASEREDQLGGRRDLRIIAACRYHALDMRFARAVAGF